MCETNLLIKEDIFRQGWAQMPLFVLRAPTSVMSASAKLIIAAVLWRVRPGGGGEVFPSYDTLSADTGLGRATVGRTLTELKKLGILSWKRRGFGKSNFYTMEKVPKWMLEYGDPKTNPKDVQVPQEYQNDSNGPESQNDTNDSLNMIHHEGSNPDANRRRVIEEDEVEEDRARIASPNESRDHLSKPSRIQVTRGAESTLPTSKKHKVLFQSREEEKTDVRDRLQNVEQVAARQKQKTYDARMNKAAKRKVTVPKVDVKKKKTMSTLELWRFWKLQIESFLDVDSKDIGRWNVKQNKLARAFMKQYSDHGRICEYIEWAAANWAGLSSRHSLNGLPSIAVLYGFREQWMVDIGKTVALVGKQRGEYNAAAAKTAPEAGWGEDA